MSKLSNSMENYLEAVYELSEGESGARITDIAARLQVSKASAHKAMEALAEKGLLTNEKYQLISLTAQGLKLAKFTSQKHAIIKKYLSAVLLVDTAVADTDACAIEHVISNDSVYAMYRELTQRKLNNGIDFDLE